MEVAVAALPVQVRAHEMAVQAEAGVDLQYPDSLVVRVFQVKETMVAQVSEQPQTIHDQVAAEVVLVVRAVTHLIPSAGTAVQVLNGRQVQVNTMQAAVAVRV
jgi:hypothetical protein